MTTTNGLPTLWHLEVSPYNEKARWALDHKRLPHVRRAGIPGTHHKIARRLGGGDTFPVLILDGAPIGDSTRIVAALERLRPQPRLYPADAADRVRALDLEDYFDEQLGPHLRVLALHHALPDPGLLLGMFAPSLRGARRLLARAGYRRLRRGLVAEFGIEERRVAEAFERVRAAGQRFRAEVGPSGYLVGDSFSVADLTLAALVSPIVAPPQFPYPQPQRGHPRFAPVRAALAEPGLVDWAHEIYERHRGHSAEVEAAST
jgi:glutathione S-transferase